MLGRWNKWFWCTTTWIFFRAESSHIVVFPQSRWPVSVRQRGPQCSANSRGRSTQLWCSKTNTWHVAKFAMVGLTWLGTISSCFSFHDLRRSRTKKMEHLREFKWHVPSICWDWHAQLKWLFWKLQKKADFFGISTGWKLSQLKRILMETPFAPLRAFEAWSFCKFWFRSFPYSCQSGQSILKFLRCIQKKQMSITVN